MLNSLDAPVFIERVALGNNKQIMQAAKVIKRAVENQVKGLGFSFVEVLSPCPTIWKMQPVEAQRFVRDEMASIFGLANLRDRTAEALPRPAPPPPPALADLPAPSRPRAMAIAEAARRPQELDLRIKVAGFGGQGVLMLGEVLAEAGLEAGYEVSWLPSYGPEMRSGTSNCHVRLSHNPIDSPLVSLPNVLLALNEPSLRKFLPTVEEGGIVFYNGSEIPPGCDRPDVRIVAIPVHPPRRRAGRLQGRQHRHARRPPRSHRHPRTRPRHRRPPAPRQESALLRTRRRWPWPAAARNSAPPKPTTTSGVSNIPMGSNWPSFRV